SILQITSERTVREGALARRPPARSQYKTEQTEKPQREISVCSVHSVCCGTLFPPRTTVSRLGSHFRLRDARPIIGPERRSGQPFLVVQVAGRIFHPGVSHGHWL